MIWSFVICHFLAFLSPFDLLERDRRMELGMLHIDVVKEPFIFIQVSHLFTVGMYELRRCVNILLTDFHDHKVLSLTFKYLWYAFRCLSRYPRADIIGPPSLPYFPDVSRNIASSGYAFRLIEV